MQACAENTICGRFCHEACLNNFHKASSHGKFTSPLGAGSRCCIYDSISRATVQNITNMHLTPPATPPTASVQLPMLWRLCHTCIARAAASSTKIWEATRSSLTRWRMMRMISRSLVDLQRDSGGSRATTTLAGSTAPKSPRHSAHSCWAFQLVGVWI